MKRNILMLWALIFAATVMAQDKTYLTFELMKVDNEQEGAYWETEEFWSKIHEQRKANGDIVAWDLWQLLPGGESQGFQYMCVTVYNDPVKMMGEGTDFQAALKAAYPDMSEEELNEKFDATPKSRDLAVRIFLEIVDSTEDDFAIPEGTVAAFNFMKVGMGNYGAYEKMESEVFKPIHQNSVDKGERAHWAVLRYMLPYGSDTYASHITVDMWTDFKQFLAPVDGGEEFSEEQMAKIQEGIATRDMKMTYIGKLVKSVK